jgi:cell division transport system permease protein
MNRYVFTNLLRNLRGSWRVYLLGTCISAISLGLCGGFYLVHRNLASTTQLWSASVPVMVILADTTSPDDARALAERARGKGIDHVHVVTPEEGKARLREALGESRDLFGGFASNPLPTMLELHFGRPPPPEQIADIASWPGVREVDDAGRWSERFRALAATIDRVGAALLILLLIAASGAAGLSVRLVAAGQAAETEIQRLVGASEAFIRGPYLLAGALVGVAGSTLALLLLGGSFFALQTATEPSEWPIPMPMPVFFSLFESGIMVLGGGAVGMLGAWFGLQREQS